MIRATKQLLFTAVGALCSCMACAPVGDPTAENAAPVSSKMTAAEQLPASPVEAPDGLAQRIEAAIQLVEQRDVQMSNGFWTVFHGILGMGTELTLYNPETNERVNAIDYICTGGQIRGMRFIPTEDGLDVQSGPMFVGQGHVDQFVAEMVQVGLPSDRKFIVDGREVRGVRRRPGRLRGRTGED